MTDATGASANGRTKVHTYEYIEQEASEHDVKFPTITRPGVLGEVAAAEELVAITRQEHDELANTKMRMGLHGDDPVEVMRDNHLLTMRVNLATESVLRAEGILAVALRRLADFNRRTELCQGCGGSGMVRTSPDDADTCMSCDGTGKRPVGTDD